MSEIPFSKFMWEKERESGAGAMESCVKLYTWINQTVLMLLFQIFWKVSQISDFFKGKSDSDVYQSRPTAVAEVQPKKKVSKRKASATRSSESKSRSIEQSKPDMVLTFTPLTKESKHRRHIRSMSDVQYSTPYKLSFRSKVGSHHTLSYDSDTRARRIRAYNIQRQSDSSDSSDFFDYKQRSLGQNILKHTDSMRIL